MISLLNVEGKIFFSVVAQRLASYLEKNSWVVGRERRQDGKRLTPIRAYMDYMTLVTTTVPYMKRILERLYKTLR